MNLSYMARRIFHILGRFMRQAYYHMRHNIYAYAFKLIYGFIINTQRIAPSYKFSRCLIRGLKPKLDEYRLYFVQFVQKTDYIRRQAIGSCASAAMRSSSTAVQNSFSRYGRGA